ncbi:MAG: ribonuclease Y [bacterium]|nr:ribonuclease Y [bacterium]
MSTILLAAGGALLAAASLAGGWFLHKSRYDRLHGDAEQRSARVLDEARREAQSVLKSAELGAREELFQSRRRFETETEDTRRELAKRTEFLDQRDAGLDKKVAYIDQKEAKLEKRDQELKAGLDEVAAMREDVARLQQEQRQRLEQIAGLSAEKARQQLEEKMIAEARMNAARTVKEVREDAERRARRESQRLIGMAVQRYASEHIAEMSVSVVDLPNDDMKGRIIGREGRNIRAFEMATGVDVIIDDTPEAVIISGFDPVRREIACQSLQQLIRDGRIHPGRIEEVVQKTTAEMQERVRELGEQACLELGLANVNPQLHPYIGRLHYRTSYGQNLLLHSKEVAAISAMIAGELGLDPKLARRCGFLHDIGKAADHEVDGPHALIGGKLLRKLGEAAAVINAVEGHHQDVDAESVYTFLTSAADAISASRPGARRESLDNYVKRLESLERIADSFEGVEKSYAIQAGREVRILVNHSLVSDAEAVVLAEEISRRVEGELEYPGQIKIMVLRETRAVAFAR